MDKSVRLIADVPECADGIADRTMIGADWSWSTMFYNVAVWAVGSGSALLSHPFLSKYF